MRAKASCCRHIIHMSIFNYYKKRITSSQIRDVDKGCYVYISANDKLHLQSRCFFFGPIISCVVALHTVLDIADPVTLCWAAVILSVMLCPDILYWIKCTVAEAETVPSPAEQPGFRGRCRSGFRGSEQPDNTGDKRERERGEMRLPPGANVLLED